MDSGRRTFTRPRFSLGAKLALAVVLLMVANGVFLVIYLPDRVQQTARGWAEDRAAALTTVLSRSVRWSLDDAEGAERRLQELAGFSGTVFAALYRADGSPIAAWNASEAPSHAPPAPAELEVKDAGDRMWVLAPISAAPGGKGGAALLVTGFSLEGVQREAGDALAAALQVGGTLVLFGGLLGVLLGAWLARPAVELDRVTARVVREGDLDVPVVVRSGDEIGALSTTFHALLEWLRRAVGSIGTLVGELRGVTGHLSAAGGTVAEGSQRIRTHVERSNALIATMHDSLDGLGRSVGALEESAIESGATLGSLAASNSDVAQKVRSMAELTRTSAGAINVVAQGFDRIARSVEELRETADETASSTTEIDASIRAVEATAGETARLAEQAAQDAEFGVEVLDKTVEGVEKIRAAADQASRAMESLRTSVAEIDTILNVIADLTAQTNVLAINAAIIAHRAGEHGSGFAVVASEIRSMADRTRQSTADIARVIATIRDHTDEVSLAMEDAKASVHDGVILGQEAGAALGKILTSSRKAREMVRAIATATKDQAAGTAHVAKNTRRVTVAVAELSKASAEQSQSSRAVSDSTQALEALTAEIGKAVRGQEESSQKVIRALDRIKDLAATVAEARRRQSRAATDVRGAVDEIDRVTSEQVAAVNDLERSIGVLRSQAQALQDATGRFRKG